MAKDEVLFGYALLDDTKHAVSIDDIDRSFTRLHKFYCPHCHNEMYATFGEVLAMLAFISIVTEMRQLYLSTVADTG